MTTPELMPQALNKAMLEAVEFVHAEGWDAPPTLFALVPATLLSDTIPDEDDAPLALVVQEDLPAHIPPGSEELGDYISSIQWPPAVVGAILAQEILFAESEDSGEQRAARLYSGVLQGGIDQTLLQLRPTEAELNAKGAFAEDDIELRGGHNIAPGVIAALRSTLQ